MDILRLIGKAITCICLLARDLFLCCCVFIIGVLFMLDYILFGLCLYLAAHSLQHADWPWAIVMILFAYLNAEGIAKSAAKGRSND